MLTNLQQLGLSNTRLVAPSFTDLNAHQFAAIVFVQYSTQWHFPSQISVLTNLQNCVCPILDSWLHSSTDLNALAICIYCICAAHQPKAPFLHRSQCSPICRNCFSILNSVAPFLHRSQRYQFAAIVFVQYQLSGTILQNLNVHQFAEIVLDNTQLNGTIPPQISTLSICRDCLCPILNSMAPSSTDSTLINLQQLYLSNTQLSGTLPPQISSTINCTPDLFNTQLNGTIPPQISTLPICSNWVCPTPLSGTIPPQISTLINLQQLDLSNTQPVAPFLHRSQRSPICRDWVCSILTQWHHSFTDLNAHQFAEIGFVQYSTQWHHSSTDLNAHQFAAIGFVQYSTQWHPSSTDLNAHQFAGLGLLICIWRERSRRTVDVDKPSGCIICR